LKGKVLFLVFALVTLGALTMMSSARITSSVQVKDSDGNVLNDKVVLINTLGYVYGHYEDLDGKSPANVWLDVYYDDGSGLKLETTLFTGNINDGVTVARTLRMSKLGTYEFRWTCQIGQPGTVESYSCSEKTQARTTIQLVVPEPAAIAALGMALLALCLYAVRKSRSK
jgi:hypothetical protein